MKKRNVLFFYIGLFATFCGFIGKVFYRDFINSNHINDLGIAGFLPSFFYVIGFSQLLLFNETGKPYFMIIVIAVGSVVYEYYQYTNSGMFDIGDTLASLAGAIVSSCLYWKINRLYPLE